MYGKQIVNHIGSAVRKYMEFGLATRAAKRIDSLTPEPEMASTGGDGGASVGGGAGGGTNLSPISDSQEIVASIPTTGDLCINCDSPLAGKFCASCGQKDNDIRRPIWSFLVDFGDDILSLDSRIIRTLGPLLFLPGSLTKSFWNGKRARYVPPVRLYIFSSIFFFLVVAVADVAIIRFQMVPDDGATPTDIAEAKSDADAAQKIVDDALSDVETRKLEESGVILDLGDDTTVVIDDADDFDLDIQMFAPLTDNDNAPEYTGGAFDDALGKLAEEKAEAEAKTKADGQATKFLGLVDEVKVFEFAEKVIGGFQRAMSEPKQLNSALNDSLLWVMAVLLPLFALLLRLFYWGKKGRLVKQLIFSLHFHSYIFLIVAFLIIAQTVWGEEVSSSLFFAAVPLYLFLGLKVASEQGWFRTIFKFFFISIFYGIMLSSAAMAAVLLGLSEI